MSVFKPLLKTIQCFPIVLRMKLKTLNLHGMSGPCLRFSLIIPHIPPFLSPPPSFRTQNRSQQAFSVKVHTVNIVSFQGGHMVFVRTIQHCNYSTPQFKHKSNHRQYVYEWVHYPQIKVYLQKQDMLQQVQSVHPCPRTSHIPSSNWIFAFPTCFLHSLKGSTHLTLPSSPHSPILQTSLA